MPTDPQPWQITHVAKGLRRSRPADLVRVNVVRATGVCHLVGVGDAHHPLAVLVQLCHLGHLGRGDGDNGGEDGGVEAGDGVEGTRAEVLEGGDNLWDGRYGRVSPSWIDSL